MVQEGKTEQVARAAWCEVGGKFAGVASGWVRWEPQMNSFTTPVTLRMLKAVRLVEGMRVLDVGCGIGDPALQFAACVGPRGSVLGVDLSEEMVRTCRDRAAAYGLSNTEFRCGAAEKLDEPEGSFDAIVGRFAIMFFPDISGGLAALRALLRPKGRLCVATWPHPSENPAFGITARAVSSIVGVCEPGMDVPGPHRLAEKGQLEEAFSGAGFGNIVMEDVEMYSFAKDVDEYWNMILEMSAFLREKYLAMSVEQQGRLESELKQELSRYELNGVIRVPARARITTAVNLG